MPPVLTHLLLIAAGGAIGALLRYGVSGVVQARFASSSFPWGTLAVNVLGCLVIGFLSAMAEQRQVLSANARTFLMIGLLGAFTTFSTFGIETLNLMSRGQWALATVNVVGSVVLCMGGVWGGTAAGRALGGPA